MSRRKSVSAKWHTVEQRWVTFPVAATSNSIRPISVLKGDGVSVLAATCGSGDWVLDGSQVLDSDPAYVAGAHEAVLGLTDAATGAGEDDVAWLQGEPS